MTGAPVAIDCASFVESMARLTKLLVANRGEIALRIIRSARLFGLKTVAVYSAADAESVHVGAADEAIAIGPAEAAKSYLDIAAIIAAAKQSGADAIHPGYGFLSERTEFARAAADARIVFVGPRPDVMAALGDKVAARRIAVAAGVPVVPGIETAEISAAREFAAQVIIRFSSRLPPAVADAGCAWCRSRAARKRSGSGRARSDCGIRRRPHIHREVSRASAARRNTNSRRRARQCGRARRA